MPRRPVILSLLLCAAAAHAEPSLSPKVLDRYKQMLAANPGEGTALDRLWKAYSESGQTGQLIDEYKGAGTFASEMILGHLYKKAARLDEAAAAFARAAKLDAASPLPSLALARMHSEKGAPAEAAAEFEKAIAALPANDPRRGETLLQLGSAWLAANDIEKAATAWERTIELDPSNLDLRRRLADSYVQNRLGDRALPHLDYLKSHSAPAERAQALQQIALIHQGAGGVDDAIRALDEALAGTAPGNWLRADLESQLIRLHQRYHRTEELEARWKKAAADSPRDLGAILQLVNLYERLGDLDQQRAWLEKLTALAPKSTDFRARLARLHVQLDQLEPAAAIYDQLIKEQPGNSDFAFERARIDVLRDAMPAARQRIAALLAARRGDEAVRQKALEFYETHRLTDLVEQHLTADAANGSEETILALANFYFAQKRDADAKRTLNRLLHPNDSLAQQAAGQARIAQILKDQNEPAAAVAAITAAIGLQPENREFFLLLAELESARANYGPARLACERAFELSRTEAERLEADQKLFESIRNGSPRAANETPRRPLNLPLGAALVAGGNGDKTNPELEDYLLKLTRFAAEAPSVDRWLRVARWHLWNRSPRVAQECAQQALSLEPNSIAARELLVKLAANDPQSPVAVNHLEELMKIDPAGKAGYQRRAGQLELQAGHVEDALRIFTELAAANPGNLDALTDLALAQQRAEQWRPALATWQQVFSITPPARRKEALANLRRIYEKLDMAAEAGALMLREIDAQTEEKERFSLFQELLAHATKFRLLPWLRDELEKRREQRADDYFTSIALGRTLKALGDKAAAFDLFADASFAASNQAETLPELVREAEDLHKTETAARLQAQLVRIVPQRYSEGFEKLAQLQERSFAIEEAAKTWEKVVARFPRDAVALQHAVDFQLKWGTPTRAAELLRRIRKVEPTNVRALAQLAELDLEAGLVDEARLCLEELLEFSPPEKSGDPIRFPALKSEEAARLQNAYLNTVRMRRGRPTAEALRALRSFWVDDAASSKNESELRLGAVRDLARIVQMKGDAATTNAWVARWRKAAATAPSEALWALFYSGATGPLLDQVEELAKHPEIEPRARQAFMWFALQTGEFDRLAKWLQAPERTAVDRDYLLVAISEYLGPTGGRTDPGLLDSKFSAAVRTRLWQTAMTFAARNRFHEATQLGQQVFDALTTQRPKIGIELAHWYLFAGETDAAKRVLRAAIEGSGEGYEAPVYAALREYFLLLPAGERAAFARNFIRTATDGPSKLHAELSAALLHGLSGNDSAARESLGRVLQLRAMSPIADDEAGSSATRYWNFVLNAGAQLQQWQLGRLATFMWEKALGDEALIRLQMQAQGEQIRARTLEIRTRLTASRMVRASSVEAEQLVAEYARAAGVEGVIPLAESLESIGAFARSIEIYRQLWEREPTNPHALRNILNACRTASDADTLEDVLWRCVRGGFYRMNDVANRDIIMQLADALEARGDFPQAQAVLEQRSENAQRDTRVLIRLAQLHEHANRPEAAEAAYRKALTLEPGNANARVALAAVLEGRDQIAAAIELLEHSTGAEADAKLAQLYLKAGRLEDAFAALERLPAASVVAPTLVCVTILAEKGQLVQARCALRNALAKNPEPGSAFPIQSRLVELLTANDDRALILRELRRLRRFAGEMAELLSGYFDVAIHQAARLGCEAEVLRELTEDWADGDGSVAAGAALVEWKLTRKDTRGADAVCTKLLARDDLGENVLQKLIGVLEKEARSELRAEALGRFARLNPLDFQRTIDWARALHGLGRTTQAVAVLDELSLRGVVSEELPGKVAAAFAEFGQKDRARAMYEQAIASDPAGRYYRVHLDFAKFSADAGDFWGAKKLLRSAFRNPANREFGDLASIFIAEGQLASFDSEVARFAFEPNRAAAARRALFLKLASLGSRDAAAALAEAHPEMLDAGAAAKLRAMFGADFARCAAVFEKLRSQSTPSPLWLDGELAALFAAWAEADLQSLQTDSAIAHLRRGHDLVPGDFAMAQRLSGLFAGRGDKKLAVATLERFIAASNSATDKDRARQLIVHLGK